MFLICFLEVYCPVEITDKYKEFSFNADGTKGHVGPFLPINGFGFARNSRK